MERRRAAVKRQAARRHFQAVQTAIRTYLWLNWLSKNLRALEEFGIKTRGRTDRKCLNYRQ